MTVDRNVIALRGFASGHQSEGSIAGLGFSLN